MPKGCKSSVLVPIFKNKGDVQDCKEYQGIKLMAQSLKLGKRVTEQRLRLEVVICEQQFGLMPRKSRDFRPKSSHGEIQRRTKVSTLCLYRLAEGVRTIGRHGKSCGTA